MDDLYVALRQPLWHPPLGEEAEDHEDDEPDVKTTYAHFGLAFYSANVLEHGIVNALAFARIMEARAEAEVLLQDPWAERFKYTMGQLIRHATQHVEQHPDLVQGLQSATATRNRLAHDFWREHAENFMFEGGRKKMITELIKSRELFKSVDASLTEIVMEPMLTRAGITADMKQAALDEMHGRVDALERADRER